MWAFIKGIFHSRYFLSDFIVLPFIKQIKVIGSIPIQYMPGQSTLGAFLLLSLSSSLPPGHLGIRLRQEGCREVANHYCYRVIPIDSYLQEFKDKEKQLEKSGLRVLKVKRKIIMKGTKSSGI